jgi:hypothetical protein
MNKSPNHIGGKLWIKMSLITSRTVTLMLEVNTLDKPTKGGYDRYLSLLADRPMSRLTTLRLRT